MKTFSRPHARDRIDHNMDHVQINVNGFANEI